MNINQQRQENRQDFQIDQNEQNINRLRKKTKELSDGFDALSQSASVSQTDIASLKTDVATAKSDIAELKSLGSATEEKIELLSYDIYRNRDIMYRNNLWEPSAIFFLCDVGAKFKLHIWFTIVGTYPENSGDATVTTTIELDGEQIYSKEYAFSGPFSDDIEYTGFFTSKKKSHKLVIKSSNTKNISTLPYYTRSNMINIELWGTNVQFLTRRNDFHAFPSDTQNLMTTTCIDNKPRFSLQNADQNLSLEASRFRCVAIHNYFLDLNQIKPFIYYYMSDDGPVYSTKPSLVGRFYPNTKTFHRIGYYANVEDNQTSFYISYHVAGSDVLTITLSNSTTNDTSSIKYAAVHDKNILYRPMNSIEVYQFSEKQSKEIIDLNGTIRLDDKSKTTPIVCIATREDGTNFMFECTEIQKSNPQIFELGFGTNINAYSTSQGFKIYMRVGNKTKVVLIKKNPTTLQFELMSTDYIDDVQEYWAGANGGHFERVGDKIFYYFQDSTTPCAQMKLDI